MKRFGAGIGAASLILMFSVLCLAVFALLSLSAANRNKDEAQKLAAAVTDFYAADSRALSISAALGGAISEGTAPARLEGIEIFSEGEGVFRFLVPIDDRRALAVALEFTDGGMTVLSWYETEPENWSPDDRLPVWRGE